MEKLECIGVPVLVGGHKLFEHFQTIDVPLKRYYIVDNSMGRDKEVEDAIDAICDYKPSHIQEVVVVQNNLNAGYPGSVNQIIRDNTDCKHWIVCGYDWHPAPGQWERVLNKVATVPFGAFLGDTPTDCMCGFLWTPQLLAKVGYLDENFFPGYFEDNDYRYRIIQSGASVDTIPLQAHHDRSSTLNSSTEFQKKNQYTFQKNYKYYVEKWGGSPTQEKYDRPFGKDYPLSFWEFDPVRRQKLRWI
tara:strand:- start:216 stop:953 length:738 start_codon:yes stop_codon:yes gene_type:complete